MDDEVDVATALGETLTYSGFKQVDTFSDPLLALEHFKPGLYDLVILDIIMPQIDGFALYQKMKEIDNKVKVCFITALDADYEALKAMFPTVSAIGELECFIRKPFEVQQLLNHVKGELE